MLYYHIGVCGLSGRTVVSCEHCEIYPEGGFRSPAEDLELEAMLRDHPVLRVTAAPDDWVSYGMVEQFYRCDQCGQQWQHAQSDFPFRGSWGKF